MPTNTALSRWLDGALGVFAAALGLYVLVRPFTSLRVLVILVATGLIVTGVSRLIDPDHAPPLRFLGAVWVAAGIAALLWPQITVRWLLWLVAAWLIVDGLVDTIAGLRKNTEHRFASIVHGLAWIIFGMLALIWPDVTLLVIALIFAVRLVTFGISTVIRGAYPAHGERAPSDIRRVLRTAGAVIALLLALGLAAISSQLRAGAPVVDVFYEPPATVPSEPGVLLRSEPYERGVPDGAQAWRILYTTTRDEGVPGVASGLVITPTAPSAAPREVIAWAHGTTGVDRSCAPSILPESLETGAFFITEPVVREGWILVATDYIGLGTEGPHPYMIGQSEGRSVLDAVRAARQLPELNMAENIVVWGHSQGGHAALWTGVLAPTYAPDLNVIGVAALAPASDLIELVGVLEHLPGGNIFASFVASAYDEHYPDINLNDYVSPAGQVTLDGVVRRCLAEPAVFTSVLSSLAVSWSMFTGDLTAGAVGDRLRENTPPFTLQVPLLLGQGGSDPLILPSLQDGYVRAMCESGQQVEYRIYPGRDHVGLVELDSPLIPDLLEWTRGRVRGDSPISTC